jgi:hypothetical protein
MRRTCRSSSSRPSREGTYVPSSRLGVRRRQTDSREVVDPGHQDNGRSQQS